MDHRAHVYSPLQNIAVWLAAWVEGEISADECLDAINELGGSAHLAGENPAAPYAGLELLKLVRTIAEEAAHSPEPLLSLVLAGPGEALGLRAGTASYEAAVKSEMGALVFPTADPFRHHVLVPTRSQGRAMGFLAFTEEEPLPAPAYLSPGEADLMLAEATRSAAALIEASGIGPAELPNPRLTVGTLSDFYDTPGLPFCTPPRAAKLFARADRVAAIIEVLGTHVTDHSLDPYVLPLMRHVRAARVAGVAHAVMELAAG